MKLQIDREKLARLCRESGILLVILHGSHAQGTATEESDVDLGILSRIKFNSERRMRILNDFGDLFGDKFDPVFLNEAEPMICYRVALHGKLLYEAEKGIFERFRLQAVGKYMDSKKFRLFEKMYVKRAAGKA